MSKAAPLLTGFEDSVYTWCAKIVLRAKGVAYDYAEANPFDQAGRSALLSKSPFGRVPVLSHHGADIYECLAICVYVDQRFEGPPLMPSTALARARAMQAVSIVNAYAYLPLVRQVFSHGYYRPARGLEADQGTLDAGLAAAPEVLDALEAIAAEGHVLNGKALGLADAMLAPMLLYFAADARGASLIDQRPSLVAWLRWAHEQTAVSYTTPTVLKGLTGETT